MFPFDPAALPKVKTRRALVAVDFQNDFVGPGAALAVSDPDGFVVRAAAAAGDVVWVQSVFDRPRPPDEEPIITARSPDAAAPARRSSWARPHHPRTESPGESPGPPDSEAFLSHDEPACARPASLGVDLAPVVRGAVAKGDVVLSKSHYSAFQGTQLLRLLRAKMVLEVFICSSLANVGVYATALDAAGHGMTITLVEDCCGYRSKSRQLEAIRSLVQITGCAVARSEQVLAAIQPKVKQEEGEGGAKQPREKLVKPEVTPEAKREVTQKREEKHEAHEMKHETHKARGEKPASVAAAAPKPDVAAGTRNSSSPGLVRPMTGLRLASNSPTLAAAEDAHTPPKAQEPEADASSSSTDESESEPESGPSATACSPATPQRDPGKPTAAGSVASASSEAGGGTLVKAPAGRQPAADSEPAADSDDESEDDDEEGGEDDDGEEEKEEEDDDDDDEEQYLGQTGLGEGDTDVIPNVLPPALVRDAFARLRDEVQWQRMSHQGGPVPRLVAVQGDVAPDGSAPVYRHPSDESPPLRPLSPTVRAIRDEVERRLGHPVNHVLLQLYRGGADYISEHSDKTLDIVAGSYIANVSLGAERTMVLRTKRRRRDAGAGAAATGAGAAAAAAGPPRALERARLPHNSLCRMGPRTNMRWLHAIRPDRRAPRDKTAAERAHGGARISLTFRRIGTFLDAAAARIWGQGATAKARHRARPVVNGQGPEAVALLRAFGAENHAPDFDWLAHYGRGFDVLHIRAAPRLFTAADAVANMRVALMLAELGVGYARGCLAPDAAPEPPLVRFVDNDAARSAVQGDVAIMLYLDACYGRAKPAPQPDLAARLTRFQRALDLHDALRRHAPAAELSAVPKPLRAPLAAWDAALAGSSSGFAAGPAPSVADFALWPVLYAMARRWPGAAFDGLNGLRRYYDAFAARDCARKVLGRADEPDEPDGSA